MGAKLINLQEQHEMWRSRARGFENSPYNRRSSASFWEA